MNLAPISGAARSPLWDLITDGALLVNEACEVLWANRPANALLGEGGDLSGVRFDLLFREPDQIVGLLAQTAKRAPRPQSAVTMLASTGADVQVQAVRAAAETPVYAISLRPLVTAAANFDRGIMFATRDPVTRLFNRDTIDDRLAAAIGEGGKLAYALVEIDQFAIINEIHGRDAGDELLRAFADRLRAVVPARHPIARIGAGRFAILAVGEDEALALIDRMRESLQTLLRVGGETHRLSISAGHAAFPADGAQAGAIATAAELALRTANHRGGNTIVRFAPEMLRERRDRLEIEADLHAALERGELALAYQPKITWGDGKLVGFEALIRWNHPGKGFISPARFIPVAEQSGLILPIGRWVVKEVCRQIASWRRAGLDPVPVAVNVSPNQLLALEFSDLMQPLKEYRIPRRLVEIEITETVLMDNLQRAAAVLDELRKSGIKVAIDDFGTGHSSLGSLRRLPINTFKIDRSFVEDVETSREARDIVATIIAMARTLSLSVVAEGVETREQAEFLARTGAEIMQGHLFAPALPENAARTWLMPR